MDWIEVVAVAIWAMLPAYVPNNVAVVAGGGPPVDGGRTWNGRRLLGDGKTWRGTFAGVLAGAVLAALLNAARPAAVEIIPPLPSFPLLGALTLPVGAMLGDIAASFVKRRLDRERGAAVPGLDQLDFVAVALLLTAAVVPDWFFEVFSLPVLVVVVAITPLLHLATNVVGYLLGLKNEPY